MDVLEDVTEDQVQFVLGRPLCARRYVVVDADTVPRHLRHRRRHRRRLVARRVTPSDDGRVMAARRAAVEAASATVHLSVLLRGADQMREASRPVARPQGEQLVARGRGGRVGPPCHRGRRTGGRAAVVDGAAGRAAGTDVDTAELFEPLERLWGVDEDGGPDLQATALAARRGAAAARLKRLHAAQQGAPEPVTGRAAQRRRSDGGRGGAVFTVGAGAALVQAEDGRLVCVRQHAVTTAARPQHRLAADGRRRRQRGRRRRRRRRRGRLGVVDHRDEVAPWPAPTAALVPPLVTERAGVLLIRVVRLVDSDGTSHHRHDGNDAPTTVIITISYTHIHPPPTAVKHRH